MRFLLAAVGVESSPWHWVYSSNQGADIRRSVYSSSCSLQGFSMVMSI